MSIQIIRATVECDGCGQEFLVELDAAEMRGARIGKWCLHDLVMDALRAGDGFVRFTRGPRAGKVSHYSQTMVFEDQCFCPECTVQLRPEDRKTLERIRERLGL